MIPNSKDIINLLKKGSTMEAQEKIMELREGALVLQEENLKLKEENQALRTHINNLESAAKQEDAPIFEKPFYWKIYGEERAGNRNIETGAIYDRL